MMSLCYLFAVALLVGSAIAGEEPLSMSSGPNSQFDNNGVTTLCVQVRSPPGQVCGPVVDSKSDENARAANGARMMSSGESSYMMEQMLRSQRPQLRAIPPPPGAVITDYIQGVPVFSMKSAAHQHEISGMKSAQQPLPPPRASEPCLDHPPGPRMVGPPMQMYPGAPFPGPNMRSFPLAPYGAEPQQMRQSQIAHQQFLEQQQIMRASADCPENLQQMRHGAPIPIRTFPPRVFASGAFLRESNNQDDSLAKQCEDQEKQLQSKANEIEDLKKKIELLSSASASEKSSSTMVEKKTVMTKSTQDKKESAETVVDSKTQKKENGSEQGQKRKRSAGY